MRKQSLSVFTAALIELAEIPTKIVHVTPYKKESPESLEA